MEGRVSDATCRLLIPTFSKPAVPDVPSFLWLPAELRNVIYEDLYELDDDIVIREWLYGGPIMKLSLPGRKLLFTCRQIYAETTALFYGRNTFLITTSSPPVGSTTESWLTRIGPLAQFVQYMVIDLLKETSSEMDVLPFLRCIWEKPGHKLRMRFVYTGQHDQCSFNAATVTNAVRLIAEDNYLDLKRYCPYPSLLSAIILNEDGSKGKARFYKYTPPPSFDVRTTYNPYLNFRIHDDTIEVASERLGFDSLMKHGTIRKKILDLAISTPILCTFDNEEFAYNISHPRSRPQLSGLISVNRAMSMRSMEIYERVPFIARAVTTQSKYAFTREFESFRGCYPWDSVGKLFANATHPRIIVLHFKLAEPMILGFLRFNATQLCENTPIWPGRTNVHIVLTREGQTRVKSFTFKLWDLKRIVDPIMTKLLKFYPRSDGWDYHYPDVWVNGRGIISEIREKTESGEEKDVAIEKDTRRHVKGKFRDGKKLEVYRD